MMEDETYGMMPRAKIESCSSAPPEKRLKHPEQARPLLTMSFIATPVDARRRDEDPEPVDREHPQR